MMVLCPFCKEAGIESLLRPIPTHAKYVCEAGHQVTKKDLVEAQYGQAK